MATAVQKGAEDRDIDGVEVRVRDALEACSEDLLWADGFILGTPENFGYMSGAMKYFLDRVYYDCLDKIDGMPYGLFVRAGTDGAGAVNSVQRILQGLSVRQVQDTVLIVGDFDERRLVDCEALGMTMAAGLAAGIF
jgi:multimeric flavodoxin WrbA